MHRPCRKHKLERDNRGHCKGCNKEWRSTKHAIQFIKEASERYRNTPEGKLRLKIRQRVHRAIRMGKLTRRPCIVCNNPKSEAHHGWGYSEEHALHIVFLCKKHHERAERDISFNETIKSGYLS